MDARTGEPESIIYRPLKALKHTMYMRSDQPSSVIDWKIVNIPTPRLSNVVRP
jgi:hypothetical protein